MPVPAELPRLGRYQVLKKIAAGGMAEVFLAKATGAMGFQRLVALKLIHSNFTRDEEFVKMFIDEARITMNLQHRNIVQVFDLDKADDTYFIAMEFVHGVNLYDVYERVASLNRWIEPSMALYLVAEISKGLHFAHTRVGADGRQLGIVHRDISPQNVLLSFEGEVKITDFGIATAAQRLHQTAAGILKGKYAYMAPERLHELPTDRRVDVFSVGVLLYELLVGENPFAGASAVETIENLLSKSVQPPSLRGANILPALDHITMKALARAPDDRYASAQELADVVTEYALELTSARRDMAAGDTALAALLAELFPEKVTRPLGGADPNVSLPLTGSTAAAAQSASASSERGGPHALNATASPDATASEGEDLDAPTILRMKPVSFTGDETLSDNGSHPPTYRSVPGFVSALEGEQPGEQPSPSFEPQVIATDPTSPTPLPSQAGARASDPSNPGDSLCETLPSGQTLKNILGDASASGEVSSNSRAQTGPSLAPQDPSNEMRQDDPVARMAAVAGHRHGGTPKVRSPSRSEAPAPAQRVRGGRWNVVATAALFAVASMVALATALVMRRSNPARAPVSVSVTSNPPGARVYMDGKKLNGTTPVHTAVLSGEQHWFGVQLEGHPDATQKLIHPEDSTPVLLHFELGPSTQRGSISVKPTPSNARILVNGADHGSGDQELRDLPLEREITIRIEAPGYAPIQRTVTLTNSAFEVVLPISLEPERKNAPVKVPSAGDGAREAKAP